MSRSWTGTSTRALARQHRCSSREIEEAVDRRLDYALDNDMRLRAIKLDIARLEALMVPFFERATKDRDVAAGTLCCKLLERRALLLGLDSPTRVDIVQMAQEQPTSSFEKIHEMIMRIGRQGREGNGVDGAVGVLSSPDDDKQAR